MPDHIYLLLMIPPKYSVAHTLGFLKGKLVIRIFRDYLRVKRNFIGRNFWERWCCVSTVGLEENLIQGKRLEKDI
jgi:putative transposase